MANALVIYRGKPQANSWAKWMLNRTKRLNKNNLISIVGKTGSGKTLSAISICEIMSKMGNILFDVRKNVVFTLNALMNLINSGELRKGSMIICDEFQCSISAREFQSKANKVFNYLLSTFRHLNLTLFFCTPFESLLDKNTRRLFHAKFETLSINTKKQTCKLKPRYLEYSDFKAEPYRKQLIVFHKDERGINSSSKVFHWEVPRPSKENEKIYEEMKFEFTSNLNKNISTELKEGKSMTDVREETPAIKEKDKFIFETKGYHIKGRLELTDRQLEFMRLLANVKGTNKTYLVAQKLNVSIQAVSKSRRLAEKKGYVVEEFIKN